MGETQKTSNIWRTHAKATDVEIDGQNERKVIVFSLLCCLSCHIFLIDKFSDVLSGNQTRQTMFPKNLSNYIRAWIHKSDEWIDPRSSSWKRAAKIFMQSCTLSRRKWVGVANSGHRTVHQNILLWWTVSEIDKGLFPVNYLCSELS
jgi:hypothetical protein